MLHSLILFAAYTWFAGLAFFTTFSSQPQSTMTIRGTSTIHDWDMKTSEIDANAAVLIEGQQIENLNEFIGSVKVESLKSGKPGMDGNCYDALKSGKYPVINFKMKQLNAIDPATKKISALFTVTIAGVTKEMIIDGVVTDLNDGYLRIKGSKGLKMTDFKIEPPSFMFGSIKTGDAITLDFDMVMSKK